MSQLFLSTKRASSDVEGRMADFIMSTDGVDRGGDVINQDGWKLANYKKNPVILWGHDQRIPPVGRAVHVGKKNGVLTTRIEFATAEQHPFAETVFQLVKGFFVNAGSVGFIPLTYNWNDKRGGFDFEEQELIEYSIVGVPMNAEALQQAKAFGLDGDAIDKAFGAFGHLAEMARKSADFRESLKPTKHVATGKFLRQVDLLNLSSP
jgi:HK97 family phage prohead protease